LARRHVEQPQTLWLSLRLGHCNWLFELEPGDERAIVVGSLSRAQVRIGRPGVAPIHFHLEREGDAICLVPGYRDDLVVNERAVARPCLLEPRSIIQFSGLRLEVAFFTLDADSLGIPSDSRASRLLEADSARRERVLSLPDSTDPTCVAIQCARFSPPPLPSARATAPACQRMRPIIPQPIIAVGSPQPDVQGAERPVTAIRIHPGGRDADRQVSLVSRLVAAARAYWLRAVALIAAPRA
jgi:hypothetical protein